MPATEEADTLTLRLPPEPAYLGIARLFAGAAARHFGVDEDRVEDVKSAISEACAATVRARARAGLDEPLAVTIERTGDLVSFAVPEATPMDGKIGSETDDLIESLGIELIQALFPEAQTTDGIRFSLQV